MANLRTPEALACLLVSLGFVIAQPNNSFPHDYPGKPSGGFSPAWQQYFEVTETLPHVTFPLGRNWAGNIPVDRPNHPNNTLFFWGWEKQNGSLTAGEGENSDEPWGIWLNGGPGSSSMLGLFFENGPLHVANNHTLFSNNLSYHKLADYIWVDQPVGTGWSTADEDGFVADEDEMGRDFMGFLANLVKVFPSLSTRPLYLTGESYAGTYIPYIMKTYFGMANPPVKLVKIAIGDGAIGSDIEFEELPTLTVIETYPQLIGYDTDVYEYFKEQSHLCGYDLNLTYPQNGHFPTLRPPSRVDGKITADRHGQLKHSLFKQAFKNDMFERRREYSRRDLDLHTARRLEKRDAWKRDLSDRANGTIDPWYGCDLHFEMIEYALNFSIPWKGNIASTGFDVYNIPDALNPEAPMDASFFLNNNATRAAIHAPTSKDWRSSIDYPFNTSTGRDESVQPMAFLSDLATNATQHNISVLIYSGNDDSLVSHISSEIIIQNTTFGGIQGFTRRPSTPWFDDTNQFAGIVHQERNWTYVLVKGAGHLVPQQQPGRAFVMLREFILGSNETGLVTDSDGAITVQGGENSSLAATVLPGQLEIFVGSGTTQSSFVYPSATIAAWNSFFATVTATPDSTSSGSSGNVSDNNAASDSGGSNTGSGSNSDSGPQINSGSRLAASWFAPPVYLLLLVF